LTLTKNLDVPRIGPPLDADDTPRRDRLVVEYNTSTNPVEDGLVQDTSGRGNDGVFYGGASYDVTKKAWTNTTQYGTGDYVYTKTNLGSGDFPFAMSFWVKMLSYNGIMTMVALGSNATNKGMAIDIYNAGSFYWYGKDGSYQLWNTAYVNQTQQIFPLNTWVHVAVVHNKGGGATTDYVYINGASVPGTASISNATGANAISFDNNPDLVIGARWATASSSGSDFCPASYSNFKLYDTALTAAEVKTLYQMGRCDDDGHVVNFSKTRVGIGLGDEEVPQAALDVKGDASFGSKVGIGTPSPTTVTTLDVNGNIKSRGNLYLAPGTIESDTKVGTSDAFLLMHHSTYNGNLGPNYPRPECGTIMTNRSGGGTFPWLMYTGLVKDVATTTPTSSLRMDWGQGSSTGTATDLVDATLNPLMTLRFSGNLGIGTTSPSTTLHIGNTSNKTSDTYLTIASDGGNAYAQGIKLIHHSPNYGWRIRGDDIDDCFHINRINADSNNASALTIKSDGNVGIGTTTPDCNLEIYGDTSSLKLTRSQNNTNYGCSVDFALLNSANEKFTYGRVSGSIADNTNGSEDGLLSFQVGTNGSMGNNYQQEKMRILSNGNVGIGTSSPGAKLHVNGGELRVTNVDTAVAQISAYGSSQGTGRLYVGQSNDHGGGIEYNGDNSPTSTGAGADYIALYRVHASSYNWTARNLYNSNNWEFRGNIGLGTSSPTAKLHVDAGTGVATRITGATQWTNRPFAMMGRNAGRTYAPNVVVCNVTGYNSGIANTSNGRFTAPTGFSGYYLVTFSGLAGIAETGPNDRWYKNGADTGWGSSHVNSSSLTPSRWGMSSQCIIYLNAGDYLEHRVITGSHYGSSQVHSTHIVMYLHS
jgi:hypothetical protein